MLVVIVYAAFAVQRAHFSPGGYSTFISAGDRYFDRALLGQPVFVQSHSDGYDGQFVYRFALDPFTSKATAHGITIDQPSLRAQRIAYPFLAYLVSLSDARAVPFTLVAINVLSLALLAWSATGIALLYGRSVWHGLIIPLYPGLLLSLSRDTTEIMSIALAVFATKLALSDRYWRAGLIACVAVLTRETTLVYLAGFGIAALINAWSKRRFDPRIAAYLLPLLVILLWQIIIIVTWGRNSFQAVGAKDFGWPPLHYLIDATHNDLRHIGRPHINVMQLYRPLSRLFLVSQIGLAAAALWKTDEPDWRIGFAWACYALMAIVFTDAIWMEPWGFLRVGSDLYATGCIIILASPASRLFRALMVTALPVWAFSCWFVQA